MRFKLYREYGAMNSGPIFDAVEQGLKSLGHEIVYENEDIPIIWSVLWQGRMANNKTVYDAARSQGKNVLILEVGNFLRGKFWRISFNNINRYGIFANEVDLDHDRPKKMGIELKDFQKNRKPEILIATQHNKSLQWKGQSTISDYCNALIQKIRLYTQRKIVIRPHPRCQFSLNRSDVQIEIPKKIPNTYDDFDIRYNFHCVINFNSGPAINAAISGIPIICDASSLAYPVSDTIENIENIQLGDRTDWLTQLSHTEWSLDEIRQGIPFTKLFKKI